MKPTSKQIARNLRKQSTDAERKLWSLLRNRQLESYKFRRQVPIGPYVVDFVCLDRQLVIELDGGQHLDQAKKDQERTRWLESRGYHVLRFWNDQLLKNSESVLEEILRVVSEKR